MEPLFLHTSVEKRSAAVCREQRVVSVFIAVRTTVLKLWSRSFLGHERSVDYSLMCIPVFIDSVMYLPDE